MQADTDSKRKQKRSIFAGTALAVIIAVFLPAAAYVRNAPADVVGTPAWWIGAVYIGFVASILAAFFVVCLCLLPIVVHEAGHLLAGRLVGCAPQRLTAGPLGWQRQAGRWRFFWTGKWLDFSGLASSDLGASHDLYKRYALMVVGGPVASLLLTLPGLANGYHIVWVQQMLGLSITSPDHPETIVRGFIDFIGFIALSHFVGCLLPSRVHILRSDGSALFVLLRGGEQAARYVALTNLVLLELQKVRSPDWPEHWITQATALPDGSTDDAFGCYYGYFWHKATGNSEEAQRCMKRVMERIEQIPGAHRPAIYLEAAFYYAFDVGNAREARKCLAQSHNAPNMTDSRRARIEACILRAEGDLPGCLHCARQALTRLQTAAPYEDSAIESRFLEALIHMSEVELKTTAQRAAADT